MKKEFIKFNRRTKKENAHIILDEYNRGLINFDTLYRKFWMLLRNPKIKQTWISSLKAGV